jgi:hypothetical protein
MGGGSAPGMAFYLLGLWPPEVNFLGDLQIFMELGKQHSSILPLNAIWS